MIDARRPQLTFGDKLIAEEVDSLYGDWMVHADAVLADDAIVTVAYDAVGGFAKMADAKTMGRWGVAVGPEVVKQIHDRIVSIARQKGIAQGAKMRVDTTVVESNIHYPTDSSLLGDGVRVLTRVMKKISKIAGRGGV